MSPPREVGSEFHWMSWPQEDAFPWPEPNTLYALGRDTVPGLWAHLISTRQIRRMLVPDYFCEEVTQAWISRGVAVVRYSDNPGLPHPRWEDLEHSGDGDLVLAVNYFGIRSQDPWDAWRTAHTSALLVEDHTHDPASAWAKQSQADYAFASLRKVLPVPEGAVLWSPKGHPLPGSPDTSSFSGSALKLAAMICKREYMEGCTDPSAAKMTFRMLQADGERELASQQMAGPAPWTRWLFTRGYPPSWRVQREANVRRWIELVAGRTAAEPLFDRWPQGSCPVAAVLVFPSTGSRDHVRRRLIDSEVYPTVLWELGAEAGPEARSLSSRLLCLPADQRYGREDIERAAEALLKIDWKALTVDAPGDLR